MEAIFIKLIAILTAIVAILQTQHGIKTVPIQSVRFGAAISTTMIPNVIRGYPLYDTPSGNLDAGYYTLRNGKPYAHVAPSLTATTTQPDGYYPVAKGIEAHEIGLQYVFYDSNNKVLGTSTDQTIGTKLRTKDAPLPTISI